MQPKDSTGILKTLKGTEQLSLKPLTKKLTPSLTSMFTPIKPRGSDQTTEARKMRLTTKSINKIR